MKWLFFWLLPATILTCNSTTEHQNNFAERFSGRFGNHEVSLFLNKGEHYFGYLWLDDYAYPLSIQENLDSSYNGAIQLLASEKKISIKIAGTLSEDIFLGQAIIEKEEWEESVPVHLTKYPTFTSFTYHFKGCEKSLIENKKSISFNFSSGSIWTDENSATAEGIRKAIRSIAHVNNNSTPDKWIEEDQHESFKDWDQGVKAAGNEYVASSETIKDIGILHESDSIITLASFVYEYSGGAHGMHHTSFMNISKKTGDVLKLKAVLTASQIARLPVVLEEVARERFNARNKNSLKDNGFFVDTIKPSDNYYILDTGVGFIYSLYELRPYAEGEVILFAPYHLLHKSRAGRKRP